MKIVSAKRTNAIVAPNVLLDRWIVCSYTSEAKTFALVPPMIVGTTNELMLRAKTKNDPVSIPGTLNGKVMR